MKVVNYAAYSSVPGRLADPYHIGGVFIDCRLSTWELMRANPVLISVT